MKKEIRTILKNRAIAMAQEPEQKRVSIANIEIIVFTLACETYGLESAFVREVCPLRDLTPLPGVPSFIFGVINVHGQILPVIDLKKFFDLPEKGLSENKKVIILYNEQMEFGIVADVVEGIQTFALEDILNTPPTLTEIGKKYLKGVTKEHIMVLEAERILNDKKIIVNEEVI
jgi:purine-binding chemotaxis protein CheW